MSNPQFAGSSLGNFRPTDIAGLTVWIDASQTGSFTLTPSTSNLATITDLAENVSYTIPQAPSWSSTAFTSANGLTYPAFNMTNGRLIRALTNSCTSFQHTAFIVGRRNVLTGDGWPAVAMATTTGGSSLFFRVLDNRDPSVTPNFRAVAFGTAISQTSNRNTTQPFLYVNTFNGAATLNSYMFHSGEYFPFFPSGVNPAFTAGSNGNAVMIGTDGATGVQNANFWPGTLCEVILYRNTVLAPADRERVEGYLSWKWGLQDNLPIGHPYEFRPLISTAPPTGFDPRSIAGLNLWLDASDTTTLTGNPVTTWADKSGAGNNATTAFGATRGTYNGYRVLTFDGTSSRYATVQTVNPASHTLITVYRPAVLANNFQGNTSLFRYQTAGVSAPYIVFPYMNGTTQRGYITSYDGTPLDAANSTLVPNSVTSALNIVFVSIISGSQQVVLNGTLSSANVQALSAGTSPSLNIGSYGAGEFFQGDVGEMMVYTRPLTLDERINITGYLAWKWGLQASLPVNAYAPWGINDIRNYTFFPGQPYQIYYPTLQLAPAFSPRSSVPGCILWLDGADPASLTGGSSWVDKSASANNGIAGPVGTNMPSRTAWFNGLNSARFAAASATGMRTTNVLIAGSGVGFIMFIVTRITSLTTPSTPQYLLLNNVEGGRQIFTTSTAFPATITTNFTNASAVTVTPTIAQNTGVIFSYVIPSTGNGVIFVNGTQGGTGTALASSQSAFFFGVNNGSAANYYNGDIAEIVAYNVTTDTVRQTIEGYLAWKWGLVANLPAGHPFKNYPPPP